jgi:hypothetical protein
VTGQPSYGDPQNCGNDNIPVSFAMNCHWSEIIICKGNCKKRR